MAGAGEPAISLAEAQAYLRIESGEEEALLAGLIRSATALCEAFTGQRLIEREFRETLAASGEWQRLAVTPVASIDAIALVAADGTETPIGPEACAVDIDGHGDGWVRVTATTAAGQRLRVGGRAGMASDCNGVPEPLRQGIARLVGHLFAARDGGGGEPPAAVTALWRPYRRMRLN